jgi:hypothetical protein
MTRLIVKPASDEDSGTYTVHAIGATMRFQRQPEMSDILAYLIRGILQNGARIEMRHSVDLGTWPNDIGPQAGGATSPSSILLKDGTRVGFVALNTFRQIAFGTGSIRRSAQQQIEETIEKAKSPRRQSVVVPHVGTRPGKSNAAETFRTQSESQDGNDTTKTGSPL